MRTPAQREPLMVEISSGAEVIGRLTPDEFRRSAGGPSRVFLGALVSGWNSYKIRLGEPERAKVILNPALPKEKVS